MDIPGFSQGKTQFFFPSYIHSCNSLFIIIMVVAKEVEIKARKRTPKGHFAVYVGIEMRRFVVPVSYLKNPTFQRLLEKAADEYGFDNPDGIVLPCDASTFQMLIAFLDK